MDRRGWARQIVNLVDFHIERECDIVPKHFKMLVTEQMFNVASCTGEEVVDANDDRSALQQALAKMRTKESRATGHQHALFKMHIVRS